VRRATFLACVRADFLAILAYIAEESGSVAIGQAVVQRLRAKCHALAALQGTLGRARPELRPGIRGFPYLGYVIFFRYVGDRFEVVEHYRGRRDIDAYFSERDEV
jgi:toxin ParE1/3/4